MSVATAVKASTSEAVDLSMMPLHALDVVPDHAFDAVLVAIKYGYNPYVTGPERYPNHPGWWWVRFTKAESHRIRYKDKAARTALRKFRRKDAHGQVMVYQSGPCKGNPMPLMKWLDHVTDPETKRRIDRKQYVIPGMKGGRGRILKSTKTAERYLGVSRIATDTDA